VTWSTIYSTELEYLDIPETTTSRRHKTRWRSRFIILSIGPAEVGTSLFLTIYQIELGDSP
jgi:hypothetical protein